jgi:hypothetical protein
VYFSHSFVVLLRDVAFNDVFQGVVIHVLEVIFGTISLAPPQSAAHSHHRRCL